MGNIGSATEVPNIAGREIAGAGAATLRRATGAAGTEGGTAADGAAQE